MAEEELGMVSAEGWAALAALIRDLRGSRAPLVPVLLGMRDWAKRLKALDEAA